MKQIGKPQQKCWGFLFLLHCPILTNSLGIYNNSRVSSIVKPNKADLRDAPYVQQGWIPLRKVFKEFGEKYSFSVNTGMSMLRYLGIDIYKPLHQLSFISAEQKDLFEKFLMKFSSANERRLFLSKETLKKKYGEDIDNPSQSAIARKKLQTVSSQNSKDRLAKARNTLAERYGVDNAFKSDKVKEAISQKRAQKRKEFLAENPVLFSTSQLAKFFDKDITTISKVAKSLGLEYTTIDNAFFYDEEAKLGLQEYFFISESYRTSHIETLLGSYVKSFYKGTVVFNDRRTIAPYELDLYFPEKKVAVEMDGIFYHNDSRVSNDLHLNKTKACEEKGIRLIHIWDCEYTRLIPIYNSLIASALGIYGKKYMARKLEVKAIDSSEWADFLDENHIQGSVSAEYRYGLYDGDTLIQGIGLTRKSHKKGDLELNRMATLLNTQVVGGFSRLVTYASRQLKQDIVSYIDRGIFNGKGYYKSGFERLCINPPTYFYTRFKKYKGQIIIPKYLMRKPFIERDYLDGYLDYWDKSEDERTLMKKNGFVRLYNCGTIKVVHKF